jgi:hypothetical protein
MIGRPEKVTVKDSDDSSVTRTGWDVTFLLNGAVDVNDYVRLESEYATGYFYVYSIQISGDNVSGDWTCKARLLELVNSGASDSDDSATPATSGAAYKVKTNGGNLMLRATADSGGTILAKMPNGTTVTGDGTSSGNWIHVEYNGTWGYAYSGYLENS